MFKAISFRTGWLYSWHEIRQNIQQKKRDALANISLLVGVPGLEPGKAGPESAVLPLHHTPNLLSLSALAELRVQRYYFFLNRQNFSGVFYKNSQKKHFLAA